MNFLQDKILISYRPLNNNKHPYKESLIIIILEFFLNGEELSLNSVNSRKLINH